MDIKRTPWEQSVKRQVLRADLHQYLENLDPAERQTFEEKISEKIASVALEIKNKYKKIQVRLDDTAVFHPEVKQKSG